jgi:hypothetical protein
MNIETRLVVFAVIIVLSVSVAVAAVTGNDALTANGQTLNPYGTSATTGAGADVPLYVVAFSSNGAQAHSLTGTTAPMQVGNYVVFGADGVWFVHDLVNGVWSVQFTLTNNNPFAITVTPSLEFFTSDVFRVPYTFAAASQGCPASGPSVNPESWLIPTLSSAGTHDSTPVTMSFQVSTLNINSSQATNATNNEPLVATSVVDTFLKLHPAANVSAAANQVQLQKSLCSVATQIGTVYGKTTTIQPGQTATVESTVNSTDWGFACSPVANALVNYNVQAGGSTYQALKTSEMIVFSPEESNICGS